MKATSILSEMGKTRSIIGYAAKLHENDEEMAKDFVFECHEQIQKDPQNFIDNFGTKIYNDIQNFVIENRN